MNRLRTASIASVALASTLLVVLPPLAHAWSSTTVVEEEVPPVLGEELERSMWKAIAARDMKTVESMLAPGFLSIHQDGSRDRAKELDLISKLDLGAYELTDFVVTREGSAIVVCYGVDVSETLAGERLPKHRTNRSSVWLMTPHGWQWIQHANLNPIPSKKK